VRTRPDQAQKEFENLVASYPKAPNIHYLYGSFLLSIDTDAALGELKKELEVSPRHVPALLQIAFEYLRQGDGAAALPYARRAAEINANSFGAHNALGRALVEMGDLEKGYRSWSFPNRKRRIPHRRTSRYLRPMPKRGKRKKLHGNGPSSES
jgi:tetratricopeptide (TPR) repeat protein